MKYFFDLFSEFWNLDILVQYRASKSWCHFQNYDPQEV
jgi:hypothetical protein